VQSGIVFTNGPVIQLFAPQGRHFEPVEVMANRTLGKPKQVPSWLESVHCGAKNLIFGLWVYLIPAVCRFSAILPVT